MAPNFPAHGLILAGMQSSSGKTAITCMLLAALRWRGMDVQPFKAGPDFIDPAYHTHFAGRASRNLDAWLMGAEWIQREVREHGAARVSILEGVMGLFDGSDVASDEGSTMELARLLDWPVVLVVPSAKTGRSLAAALRGFVEQAGPRRIAGVILNQVGGLSHAEYLHEAISPLKLPVLGAVPVCEEIRWPERHLGLQARSEMTLPSVDELARLAEQWLDVAQLAGMLSPVPSLRLAVTRGGTARIAVARDEAFHFYYESNLDFFHSRGAELVEFSPLRDTSLPSEIDGLLLGGGFPEVFAAQLSDNQAMRSEIHAAIAAGLPCYAECGGLMYLAKEIVTRDGRRFPMIGAVPGAVEMTTRLHHFGYCVCEKEGAAFRGHEFHYSRWLGEEQHANLWNVRRKRGGASRREGFAQANLRATYVHHFFPSSEAVIAPLLGAAKHMEVAAV